MNWIVPEDIEILKHMLGISSSLPMYRWGYRNNFIAAAESLCIASLCRLESCGLVVFQGKSKTSYDALLFSATEKGAKTAGIPDFVIKKMFGGKE